MNLKIGAEYLDAKHGARCRLRGYRIPQAGQGASEAPDHTLAEVELLEPATRTTYVKLKPMLHPKGAIVLTKLVNLTEVVKA